MFQELDSSWGEPERAPTTVKFLKEQPGFVPPSRLGTNQSERIATETKELTAARLARFSAINTSYGN